MFIGSRTGGRCPDTVFNIQFMLKRVEQSLGKKIYQIELNDNEESRKSR